MMDATLTVLWVGFDKMSEHPVFMLGFALSMFVVGFVAGQKK